MVGPLPPEKVENTPLLVNHTVYDKYQNDGLWTSKDPKVSTSYASKFRKFVVGTFSPSSRNNLFVITVTVVGPFSKPLAQ